MPTPILSEISVSEILAENNRRHNALDGDFNPISGRNSPGKRVAIHISDFPHPVQWIPVSMADHQLTVSLAEAGSIQAYCRLNPETSPELVIEAFSRLRCRHDFPFWAATLAKIKRKGGGPDTFLLLNPPQRKLVEALEDMRTNNLPIRLILLKARQWGGSTCIQLYMAWLQLVVCEGLNSLIIAHQSAGTDEIKDMYDRMMENYPAELLHPPGEAVPAGERKMQGVGNTRALFEVAARNAKIKLGTAERPDACRGADYSLLHLSEVALWRTSDTHRPEDTIRAATSGVLFAPGTMIVMESTANGTGNFFHREYEAARRGESQYRPLFVSWFEIPQYSLPIESPETFAAALIEGRDRGSGIDSRDEPGRFLWQLWERGATLEAINWYQTERRKYVSHSQMASEYPSDEIEAFSHSGNRVFDIYLTERLRADCRRPAMRGELEGDAPSGEASLRNISFHQDSLGELEIWELPDDDLFPNRYVAAVDIGGRSQSADWSVVVVLDRKPMCFGQGPKVVAQWRGHIDMDLLAWKAARIASFYGHALLVIESNTIETRDPIRNADSEMGGYLLASIKEAYENLYARSSPPDSVIEAAPLRLGFHTNVVTKGIIIGNLIKVVREGCYTERDERCVDELLTYERRQNGSFGAIEGCHDDLLMTRAIGLHIAMNELPPPSPACHHAPLTATRHFRRPLRPDLAF